ncbi:MAG TPA: AAA family ATPase [Phycisphaerae bacterium]|nr:AAA family ATPase [Phycisphaerae bacterium]
MRTISLINQKGGCGKTTSSINLAACLAHLNQRTLLVDMDPQGHCAVGLAVPDAQIEKSVYDVLRAPGGGSASLKDITWQIASNFDLAPSTISLAALETELHGIPGRQDRLSDALSRVAGDYDFCIIDCPPNVGLLTFNAMRASTDVIIPVETGYFSLHGLSKQLELLEQLKKQCHQDLRIRILATLYDIRTKLAREVLAELREQFGTMLMEATINFNTKLKEAASFGQPITEYDAASKGFKDFLKLARELMGPGPRMALNLPRAVAAEVEETEAYPDTLEGDVARAQNKVEETLEVLQDIAEFDSSVEESTVGTINISPELMSPPSQRRSRRVPQELSNQVAELTRKADEVKAAAQKNLGLAISSRAATTSQKIEEFYGVRQVPEGLLFVAHFPNAQNVSIAGDFNNWTPIRMASDRESGSRESEAEATFRTLVSLRPGRYRYRLVVDGRWQSDPHNVHALPNPFGELDSVVEVI